MSPKTHPDRPLRDAFSILPPISATVLGSDPLVRPRSAQDPDPVGIEVEIEVEVEVEMEIEVEVEVEVEAELEVECDLRRGEVGGSGGSP